MTAPSAPPVLMKRPAAEWPQLFGWLPRPVDPLRSRILSRAHADWGMIETSPNRGPEIDAYLRRFHVPESLIEAGKGYWCAAWVASIWADAGAKVPRDAASCDAWLPFLVPCTAATIATVAQPGDAVLYGVAGDAKHIGLVVRTAPVVLTVEGNRGLSGSATNNGVAVHTDQLTRKDVLGVVRPVSA
jgi:hypothetical protein